MRDTIEGTNVRRNIPFILAMNSKKTFKSYREIVPHLSSLMTNRTKRLATNIDLPISGGHVESIPTMDGLLSFRDGCNRACDPVKIQ